MKSGFLFFPAILFFFVSAGVFPLPFNSNLSQEELDAVLNGQTLIRNLDSYEEAALATDNAEINQCLEDLCELDPKYFVEVILTRKIRPGDGIVGKVYEILSNVESYTEIPYYSERHGTTTPLYSYSKILADSFEDGVRRFTADIIMPPFELCTLNISIQTDGENFLLYRAHNVNDMACYAFVRVKENRLRSVISVFQHEDNWIVYGIGAAKAPKIPLLTRRIEVAFVSRVKAFCDFATKFLNE